LPGCEIVGFSPDQAHEVGELLGVAGSAGVVDAHLVLTAALSGAVVLTSERDEIHRLVGHLSRPVEVRLI
jgi:hypothetical protein